MELLISSCCSGAYMETHLLTCYSTCCGFVSKLIFNNSLSWQHWFLYWDSSCRRSELYCFQLPCLLRGRVFSIFGCSDLFFVLCNGWCNTWTGWAWRYHAFSFISWVHFGVLFITLVYICVNLSASNTQDIIVSWRLHCTEYDYSLLP